MMNIVENRILEKDKMISPFSKRVFGVRLGEVILLFGMETIIRGCVFGWHGREKFGCFSR